MKKLFTSFKKVTLSALFLMAALSVQSATYYLWRGTSNNPSSASMVASASSSGSTVTFTQDGLSTSTTYYYGIGTNSSSYTGLMWTSGVSQTGNVGGTTSEGSTPATQEYYVGSTRYMWTRIKPLVESLKITGTISGSNVSINYAAGFSITADSDTYKLLDVATLTAAGGSSPYKWEYSTDGGSTYTTISGATGSSITFTLTANTTFKCTDGAGKVATYSVKLSTSCSSGTQIFYEDFGSYGASGSYTADKRRSSCDDVPSSYFYVSECYTMKNGGDYAIVTNPIWGGCGDQGVSAWGCDCTSGFWYRNTYDHTQGGPDASGKLGGMLMLNCKDGSQSNPDVLYQKTVTISCPNTLLNVSLWVQAAWDASRGSNPVSTKFVLRDGGPTGTVLDEEEIEISGSQITSGWTQINGTFTATSTTVTIQFVNMTSHGDAGNDLLIDDIEFYACRPDANLQVSDATLNPTTATDGTVTVYAVKPYQNATHYDQVGLEAVFNTSTIANPYYYWLRSIDNGSTWTEVFGASGYGSSYKSYTVKSTALGWYKVAIATDRQSAINIVNGTTDVCGLATVTNVAKVLGNDISVNMSLASDLCRGKEAQYDIVVTNPFDYEIKNVGVNFTAGEEGAYTASSITHTSGPSITYSKVTETQYNIVISNLSANSSVRFSYKATPTVWTEGLQNTAKTYITYIRNQKPSTCAAADCMWNQSYDAAPDASKATVTGNILETCDDFSLTLSPTTLNICYGNSDGFNIYLKNNGTEESTPTGIKMTLPSNIDVVLCGGSGFTYDPATGIIESTAVPAGATRVCNVEIVPTSMAAATIGFELTTDHTKTASLPVVIEECLPTLTVDALNEAVCYGTHAKQFVVTVKNEYGFNLNNVIIGTELTSNISTARGFVPSIGTYDDASGHWTIPTLESGVTATLEISYVANYPGTSTVKSWFYDFFNLGRNYTYATSKAKDSDSQTSLEELNANITVTGDPTICVGSSSEITITPVSGTAPFSITYSDGSSTNTITNVTGSRAISVSPASSTTYSLVSMSDARSCQKTFSTGADVTINVDKKPVGNAGTLAQQCNNDVFQLAGTLLTGTGVWTTSTAGVVIDDAASPTTTISNVPLNGDVEMVWTVSNGVCPAVTSSVHAINNDCTDLTATIGDVRDICAGGDLNYKITITNGSTVTANNVKVGYTRPDNTIGTKTYSSIAPGASEVIIDTYSAPASTESSSKEVSVKAIKDGGSFITDIKNFTVNPLPANQTITASATAYCAGSNVTLGLAGSQSGVTYTLNRGNGVPAATMPGTGSALDFSGTYTSDRYTVHAVYDATSCQTDMTEAMTITENPLPTISVDTTYNKNCVAPFSGEYTINGSDGSAPYMYSNDGGSTYSSNNTYKGLESAMVQARVKDANGCESEVRSFELINSATTPTQFNVMASATEYCAVDATSGVTITLSGSENGFNYQLMKNGTVVKTLSGDGGVLDFGTVQDGTYKVYATNETTKCSEYMRGEITIERNELPQPTVSATNNTRCVTEYNGSYSISAKGGSGSGYLYSINGSEFSSVNGKTKQQSASDVVRVKDSKGCISAEVPAVILDSPVALQVFSMTSADPNNEYCEGTAGVELGLSGSENNVNYTISEASGAFAPVTVAGNGSAISFGAQKAGSYTVHAVNVLTGCEADMTGSITLIENKRPVTDATLAHNDRCSDPYNGYYEIHATSGSGNYLFSIDNGTTFSAKYRYDNIKQADIYAKSKDSKGCVSEAYHIVVNNNATPLTKFDLLSDGGKTTYCSNEDGVALSLSGSENDVVYTLYKDGVSVDDFSGSGSSINFGKRAAGTYNVTALNSLTGCTADMNGSVTLHSKPAPKADFSVSNNTRCLAPYNGSYTILATGGSGSGYTYSNNDGQSFGNQYFWDEVASADFYAKVKDGDGCISDHVRVIVENKASDMTVYDIQTAAGATSYCANTEGVEILLSGSQNGAEFIYSLINATTGATVVEKPGTGSAISFGNQKAGEYRIAARNTTTGCTTDMNGRVTLTENKVPTAAISGSTSICVGSDANLNLTVNDYFSSYVVTYKVASSGAEIGVSADHFTVSPAATETYNIVKVEDANGCVRTYSAPFADAQKAVVTVDKTPVSIAGVAQTQYNNSIFTMAANQPQIDETGVWSIVSITPIGAATPVITNKNLYNTTVTGVGVGSTVTLQWTVSSALDVCAPASSTVEIKNVDGTDLALTSQFENGAYCANEEPKLTITLVNGAARDASDVVVTNAISKASIKDGSVTVSSGTYDYTSNIWTVGDIVSGSTVTLTALTVPTSAVTDANITDKAYVSSANGINYASYDAAPASMKTTATTTAHAVPVLAEADVTVVNNTSCDDANLTGSITVKAGFYEYSFDGGTTWGTSNTLAGIKSGSYSIKVRSQYGCVSNAIPAIVENKAVQPVIQRVAATNNGEYCEGVASDVHIVVAGSQTEFNYQLYKEDGSSTSLAPVGRAVPGTGSSLDFGAFEAGKYYVKAVSKISETCDAFMNDNAVEITENPKPVLTYKIYEKGTTKEIVAPYVLTCNVPEMDIVLDGGATYQWSDGETQQTRTVSESFSKNVYPISEKGCSGEAVEINITVDKETPKDVKIVTTPADADLTLTCKNQELTLTASSTTANVTYKWNDAAQTEGTVLKVSDISTQNIYKVTVTAANGCTSESEVEIKENKNKPLVTISSKDETGADNDLLNCTHPELTLTANVNNTEAVGVCTFEWSTLSQTPYSSNNPLTVTSADIYSVVATGENGCASEKVNKTIREDFEKPIVTIEAPTDTLTCNPLGRTITLTAKSDIANSTFVWNTQETAASLTVNAGGDYSVMATAPNGCQSDMAASINITDKTGEPSISIDQSAAIVTCEDVTLTASCNSCQAPEDRIVRYKWNDVSFTEGDVLVINKKGTYTVTAVNRFDCVATATVEIDEDKTAPVIEITPDGGTLTCAEPELTVTVVEKSGLRDVSYVWTDDQSESAERKFTRPDIYTVVATNNATKCTTEASVEIKQNTKFPSLNVVALESVCMPATVDISKAVASSSVYDEIFYYDAPGSTVPMASTVVDVDETTTYYVQAVGVNGSGCASEIMPIVVAARRLADTPTVVPYDECPVPGKKSMRDLVTSDKTNLKFYDSIEGGSEVSDMFDAATENSDYTYYVSNTTKDQCESERAEINIHVDGTIDYDLIASAAEVIAAQDEVTISVIPTKDTQIEKYSWTKNGNAFQSDSDEITDILYTNSEFAVNASGRCNSITKKVTVRALWPTVIVPDGPGKNGEFARGCNITVFNRFNEKVFEGNDGWDGTLNCALAKKGVKADPGVYYYYIVIPDGSTQKGIIEVVKF